ncbi:hypothetical protein SAMN06295888_13215 [Desulfonatronum zhilinae]|nr:hypothetical protein SAMN06295888_13215 [Desulfonatronum zhilinae]
MIFIDTGAFLAKFLSKDQYHSIALDYWELLENQKIKLFTSNFILNELVTLMGIRAGYQFAAQRLNSIYNSVSISIWRPEKGDELQALDWYTKYSDQKVSFTDCLSFTMMSKAQIQKVFSFDRHFDLAGFVRVPEMWD